MSVQAITWALSVRTRSGAHKAVLLVLANYANDVNACWPSQAVIADEACCCPRTVRTILKHLETDGLIERETRRRTDGKHTSDRITLAVKHPEANLAGGKSCQRQNTSEPAANLAYPVEDKPLLEPTNEPLECVVSAQARETAASVKQRCFAALGPGAADPAKSQGLYLTANCIAAWVRHGCDLEADVLPTIAAMTAQPRSSPISTWRFFEAAVYRARDLRLAEPPPQNATPSQPQATGAVRARDPQPAKSAAEHAMDLWRARQRVREAGRPS
jgi:hypothetical protein